ncbi:MAG: hypothetical protein U0Q16_04210 [Bryobacteraceae bacterium]
MHRRSALLVAACSVAQLAAQQVSSPKLSPDLIRISRIKYHMSQTLGRMPNYTCTQTIERSRRPAKSRKFQLLDTIRLEVALVDGKELFAWPGATRFEDREISELVGGGAIGNGNFALHAKSVLMSNFPTYQYLGTFGEPGAQRFRYSYDVPQIRSGFMLRDGVSQAVTGYKGTFDVDAESLDLIRLEVLAEEIPSPLLISRAQDIMFYERTRIGEADFLLPKSSEMTISTVDGTEGRNRVSFAGCRQYSGESTISFADAPDLSSAPPPAAPVIVEIPLDLVLDVRLTSELAVQPAIIGTVIEGEVASNAKHHGSTMVPKGAKLRGRLIGAKPWTRGQAISLEFFDLEFPGARAEIFATPDEATGFPGGPGTRTAVGRDGVIYFTGNNATHLRKGTRMLWRTRQKPPESSNNTQRHSQ